MQKLTYIFLKYYWVLIVLLVALSFYKCGQKTAKDRIIYKEKKVIEKRIDTIVKEIKGKGKEVIKYKDRVKYLKENTPYYPRECETIVKWKDSIINNQDTIILYKDSIIYLDRKVIEYKDKIIEVQPKKGLGFKAGFVVGVGACVATKLILNK